MKLVKEDKNGAYLGATSQFLQKFVLKENNKNFEVYDSNDGNSQFIAVKNSRLPNDSHLDKGVYGINYHRARPDFETAKEYYAELATGHVSLQKLNRLALAATTKDEYVKKSAVWEKFYSYVWDKAPQNVWVTPHSGNVTRKADDVFPFPTRELDAFVAGVAARCAFNDLPAQKRTMMSIHSHNWHGAVLDLGDFGINDEKKLKAVAVKVEKKYSDEVQTIAEGCRRDFAKKVMAWLEIVQRFRGTLNPEELRSKYGIERHVVFYTITGLKLYGIEITSFTLKEFRDAINSLHGTKMRVVSCNHLFTGQNVSRQLKIAEKIKQGKMDNALQVECLKYYLEKKPELMADILLDIKHGLFE
ncbi:MAG: hypothetical protein PHG35_05445 [Dehalococcoidales bacterium]|nr:hypothetical protein [Dehalococcoidales bacterium]